LAAGHALAVRLGADRILELRSALSEAHKVIRDISLPRLWLESELIRLAIPKSAPKAAVEASKPKPQTAAVQQPENLRETPVAPKKDTKPVPTPVVAEAESEEIAGELVAPELTGDEELDRGRTLWYETLASLPKRAAIYIKLFDSKVIALDGDILHVAVTQKLIYDWLHDMKKPRLSYISEEVQKVAGRKILIEFSVLKNGTRKNEPVAVELPAEGPKLIQMAREVFGSIGNNTKDEVT
jgi:DNA polymerase-3 subunit gamma/tau